MNITIQRDGIDIDVKPVMRGPDPSVGILYAWVDERTATDPDGNPVELTDYELWEVAKLAEESARGDEFEYDDD